MQGGENGNQQLIEAKRQQKTTIGQCKDRLPCVLLVNTLAKLSLATSWKIENVPHKLVSLAKNISRLNAESVSLYLLVAYKKALVRNLKKGLFNVQVEFTGNTEKPGHAAWKVHFPGARVPTWQRKKWPQSED